MKGKRGLSPEIYLNKRGYEAGHVYTYHKIIYNQMLCKVHDLVIFSSTKELFVDLCCLIV